MSPPHRPHRDFHAFKWKSWTVPFSCPHYAALPFSVLYPISELSCKQTQLEKEIIKEVCILSALSRLLLSLYVQGEIPSPACPPPLSGVFTSFLAVIQYLYGSPEHSDLVQLPGKQTPALFLPTYVAFIIPGPWSYCFLKHFCAGFFFPQLPQKWEFFSVNLFCTARTPPFLCPPEYIWMKQSLHLFSSITGWF